MKAKSSWWIVVALAVIAVAYLLGEGDLDTSPGPHAWLFLLVIFIAVFVSTWQRRSRQSKRHGEDE
jgi:hypothetical protein